jgi:hypothetical protein
MPAGAQISGQKPNVRMPRKPGAATPVIVNSAPLIRTLRPTTEESP